jgi:hypothetical protein
LAFDDFDTNFRRYRAPTWMGPTFIVWSVA